MVGLPCGILWSFDPTHSSDAIYSPHSPRGVIVLMAKTNSGQLISHKYILSPPTGQVWGLDHSCGNKLCEAGPGNIKSNLRKQEDNHDFAKFTCNRCRWLPQPLFLKQVCKGSYIVKYFFIMISPSQRWRRTTPHTVHP